MRRKIRVKSYERKNGTIVRGHTRRLNRVRAHTRTMSTGAQRYLTPEEKAAYEKHLIEELGRDFTEEEIVQMMEQAQTQADIDQLLGKIIIFVKAKQEENETVYQRRPTQKELEATVKPRTIPRPPTKKQKSGQTQPVHWLEYGGKQK